MTESLGNDLDGRAVGNEQRRVGVAEVVKPDSGQARTFGDAEEQLADGLGVEVPAGGVAEHPVVGAVRQPVVRESALPGAKDGRRAGVEIDASPARPGFDAELDGAAADGLDRASDREPAGGEVEVAPAEPGDFASPHAGVRGEVKGRG